MPFKRYWLLTETGDLRYVLNCEELPEYYDSVILQDSWDNIMKEYETLTGFNEYSSHLKKTNYRYAKKNDLNILTGAYLLMRLGSAKSLDYLKILGEKIDKVSPENVNKLRNKILGIRTRQEIEGLVRESTEPKEKITFEAIIITLEMALGYPVDENMTIIKYVETIRAINKKAQQYGRAS